ncbi:MAG: methylcobamide--CoM methyltransferase [Candidatus Micrarchaeia archaeon]
MITTVVGNYPKIGDTPEKSILRESLHRMDRGEITEAQMHEIARKVTKEVIEEQVSAGIDIVTDGQILWEDEVTYFAKALEGIELNGLVRFFDTNTYYRQPVIKGKIEWKRSALSEDFSFAKSVSKKQVKAVIPGPYTLANLSINKCYKKMGDVVGDFAAAIKKEARALVSAGARMIQLNEPAITRKPEDFGILEDAVGEICEVKADWGIMLYFGDYRPLYKKLVSLPVNIIGLDVFNYGIPKDFPEDKVLCAGLVDARNTKLEDWEWLGEKIRKLLSIVESERLHVSPNCGLEFLPRETAFVKLRNMVRVVRNVEKGG